MTRRELPAVADVARPPPPYCAPSLGGKAPLPSTAPLCLATAYSEMCPSCSNPLNPGESYDAKHISDRVPSREICGTIAATTSETVFAFIVKVLDYRLRMLSVTFAIHVAKDAAT